MLSCDVRRKPVSVYVVPECGVMRVEKQRQWHIIGIA